MNLEANDLLARMDQWKFKLHEKLALVTPSQRAAFWRQTSTHAANLGLPVEEKCGQIEPAPKRAHRRTGLRYSVPRPGRWIGNQRAASTIRISSSVSPY